MKGAKLHITFQKWYGRRAGSLQRQGVRNWIFKSGGYVIILVLIMTTLLISVTAEFIVESQVTISYMRKYDSNLKGSYLAKSGIKLATAMLMADKKGLGAQMITGKAVDKNIDCYDDIWAMNLPPVPIGNGSLSLKISDENSKINVNAFANEFTEKTRYYIISQTFFLNMGLPMDFADIIHDWVDIDDSRFPYGAETSDYYLTLIPSYSAKNGGMDSIDEMLMLKDMTPEIFYGMGGGNAGIEENLVDNNYGKVDLDMSKLLELSQSQSKEGLEEYAEKDEEIKIGKEKSRRLSRYFRVHGNRNDFLHEYNKININTATYRVLSALTENMTDDKVAELIRRRQAQPFKSTDEIREIIDDDTIFDILKKYITVKSSIFQIKSVAQVNNSSVTITAVYNRDTRKFLYWCEE